MPHKLLTIKNGTHGNLLHDEVFLNIWNEFFAEVPPVDAPLLTTGLNSAQLPMLAVRLSQAFSVNVSSMFLLKQPEHHMSRANLRVDLPTRVLFGESSGAPVGTCSIH